MKLLAAVIVRNELARYLEPCVAHLLEFCDEVRLLDDGSSDGWQEALRGAWGDAGHRVIAKQGSTRADGSAAFNQHAAARNQLLRFALDGWPDAILAIDADEFVCDGTAARREIEKGGAAWALQMEEVWEACDDRLCVREDGGWAAHPVTMAWAPEMRRKAEYRIADNGHATGRTPAGVGGGPLVGEVLHLGWASRAGRAERFARYRDGDGGKYHAKAHIESIMWPDSLVTCRARAWPAALEPWRPALLATARTVVPA